MGSQAAGEFARQRLAAGQHGEAFEVRQIRAAFGQERLPQRRRRLHDGGARHADRLRQRLRVLHGVPWHDDDRGPANERQVKLQRRDVEADGGDGEQPVMLGVPVEPEV